VSNVDAVMPIAGLLVLGFVLPPPRLAAALTTPAWASTAGVLGLGLTLGLIFLLAAGRRAPLERGWLVLLGAAFLAAGMAGQLGLPEVVVGFVAGAVTTQSAGGRRLSDVVAASERPVALLIAVIVGIRLAPDLVLCGLAFIAFDLRIASQVLTLRLLEVLRPRDEIKGLAFLGYGGFPMAIAAQIDLTYGGWLGALTLTSAAAVCLASDALGAARLFLVSRRHRPLPPLEPSNG
jgi:hypothetical protein